jgi:(S)-sulfolactate dehydrogenase
MSAPVAEIAVVEDVWGPTFDALAAERTVLRVPDAWQRPAELPALLAGVSALVVRNRTTVDRSLLASCAALRIVGRAGVGMDNIDVPAADELGVVVSVPFGANAVSVAEHTVGLALAVARHTVPLDTDVRSGGWQRRPGRELAGRTWGLLGLGATGRAVAALARALGMRVIAYDPYVPDGDIPLVPLTQVARDADVISVHLPATAETRGLVDDRLIAAMRPDAILVNAGRGEVVDEPALADALSAGHLFGAGLDVRATEPPTPGPLENLPNVVLTPHVAGITAESQDRITQVLAQDIRAVLDGGTATSPAGIGQPRRQP